MTEPHHWTRDSTLERLARAALSPEENDLRKAILTAFAEEEAHRVCTRSRTPSPAPSGRC